MAHDLKRKLINSVWFYLFCHEFEKLVDEFCVFFTKSISQEIYLDVSFYHLRNIGHQEFAVCKICVSICLWPFPINCAYCSLYSVVLFKNKIFLLHVWKNNI
jgi:hypothetical protein